MMNSEFIDGLDLDLYPTLNGSRYMLVEYNVLRDIHSIDYRDDCLYELKVKGFVPVIAHIERYFHSGLDYSIIDNWIDYFSDILRCNNIVCDADDEVAIVGSKSFYVDWYRYT